MSLPGPQTRIVELRVPGTTGVSGESLLDCAETVEVDGDQLGKVIRPADRLNRPAPGPVVQALGRSVPRILEGYLWDGLASGWASRAAWALLFPFSLANVAHWMLPPTPEKGWIAKFLSAACRSLLRISGLLLTMLLITQLALISLDLLAAQCLEPGSSCLAVIPQGFRELDWARIVVGVVPPVLVIGVLYAIGGKTWATKTPATGDDGVVIPADNFRAAHDIAVMRCFHALASLGCLALLLLGDPFQIPTETVHFVLWCCALALVGLPLVLLAVLPEKARAHVLSRWIRKLALLIGLAVVTYAAIRSTPLSPALSGVGLLDGEWPGGANGTVESIGAALLAVNILLALVLACGVLVMRSGWRRLPKRLRPWLGGWAAAPVSALAGLLGGGLGAGIAIVVRKAIGNQVTLPETYTLITTLWGGGLILAVVLAVAGFAIAVPLRRQRRGVPAIVHLLQTRESDKRPAASAWARSAWERRHLHHLVTIVVFALSLGVAAILVDRFYFHRLPDWTEYLSEVGLAALGLVVAGLLRVFYTATKGMRRSRHLGALADLVCFWPRTAHPTIPPCYPDKVVSDLTARVRIHLAEPNTHVVLTGHHLGSLVSVLAIGRLTRELSEMDRERIGLVAAGSPLQWGYQRAFPAIFPISGLTELYGRLGGRWRGLARGTDVFGGGVTTWRHQVVNGKLLGTGYQPSGSIAPLSSAEPSPTGALVLGGDHWLPDPLNHTHTTRRWAAGVLRHRDYLVDPEWDHAVVIAAGLERPAAQGFPTGEQPTLFGDFHGFSRD